MSSTTVVKPTRTERILVVDDEPGICQTMLATLQTEGYGGDSVASADEAIHAMDERDYALVLADIRMPGTSGLELLALIRKRFQDVAVIMVTALNDRDLAVQALKDGAYGYVTKPFSANELLISVINALHRRQLELENRAYNRQLESVISEQTHDIRRSHEEIALRLIAAQSVRHDETGAHVKRIGLYAEVMGQALGFSSERNEVLRLAAPMHDVGKIGISDSILLKPGPLTTEEFDLMKQHTVIGSRILEGSELPLLATARNIALSHHERWDGSGYPNGLAQDAIPLEARIVAILDVYDALVHRRVYRDAMDEAEALRMIGAERERHFDPDIHDIFLDLIALLRDIRRAVPESEPVIRPLGAG